MKPILTWFCHSLHAKRPIKNINRGNLDNHRSKTKHITKTHPEITVLSENGRPQYMRIEKEVEVYKAVRLVDRLPSMEGWVRERIIVSFNNPKMQTLDPPIVETPHKDSPREHLIARFTVMMTMKTLKDNWCSTRKVLSSHERKVLSSKMQGISAQSSCRRRSIISGVTSDHQWWEAGSRSRKVVLKGQEEGPFNRAIRLLKGAGIRDQMLVKVGLTQTPGRGRVCWLITSEANSTDRANLKIW